MSLWSLIWIVVVVLPLIALWFYGLADLIRRHDLSTGGKVLWALLIIFLPILGVFIYFYVAPSTSLPADTPGIRSTAVSAVSKTDLADIDKRYADGRLSDKEYQAAKDRLEGAD